MSVILSQQQRSGRFREDLITGDKRDGEGGNGGQSDARQAGDPHADQ